MMESRHTVNVRPPADPGETSGPSRMLVCEGFETGLECSVDTDLQDGTPRRFVQTNLGPFVYVDRVDEFIASPEGVDVVFHPNDHQVKKLLENKCSPESIQEAFDECLANFEWPSKMVDEQKLSSFKLVIEKRLSRLLEEVLDLISDFSKQGQLFQLLRQAFTEFGAQLQSIQLGSLTFHFHYTDQATALSMTESEGAQGKLIGLLHQFLPDWVRIYARWDVQHYSSTEHRPPSFTWEAGRAMVWRIPLTPHSSHTGRPNQDAVDAEALTHIIEPMINRSTKQILSKLDTVLTSLQDTIVDQIQRAIPTPQSVTDVSSEETASTQESPDADGNIGVVSIVSKESQEAESSAHDGMATKTQAYPENIWIPFTHDMYPRLLTQTYFYPPIFISRAPFFVEAIAGQTVSVRGNPLSEMPRSPPAKSSARREPLPTPPSQVAGTLFVANPPDLQSDDWFQESELRRYESKEQYLHALSDIPGQVMMVIYGLQFNKYLGDHTNPLHAASIAQLPAARPTSLILDRHDYPFDILIIHQQFGLVVGEEVKPIHPQMLSSSSSKHTGHYHRIKQSIQWLQKLEIVLRHLVSDLPPIRITKTILFPKTTSDYLRSALSSAQLNMDLCEFTKSASLKEAVGKCLCKEDVTQPITWWNSLMGQEPDPCMTDDLYQRLVARFCGPATTVHVPYGRRSGKVVRSMGQAVAETGLRFSYLALTPTQVDLLYRDDKPGFLYLQGPPGTGKSIVLLLKALQQLTREGTQVVIVGEDDTQANTMLMKEQLLAMVEPEAASRIQTHYCDFSGDEFDAKDAVSKLQQQLGSGPALIILSEVCISDQFIRWTRELRSELPGVAVWASGPWMVMNPVPDQMEILTFQEPQRRPPELVREMEKTMDIQSKGLVPYVLPEYPIAGTQGFPVRRLQHQGQPGHSDGHCLHCAACADAIADLLKKELRVGQPDHWLQYRDTWILCGVDPHADDPMIQRLQQHHRLPVGVVASDPLTKDDARKLALAGLDHVTVTHYKHVRGLERRVVIGLGLGEDPFPAMSTSTSFYCCVD